MGGCRQGTPFHVEHDQTHGSLSTVVPSPATSPSEQRLLGWDPHPSGIAVRTRPLLKKNLKGNRLDNGSMADKPEDGQAMIRPSAVVAPRWIGDDQMTAGGQERGAALHGRRRRPERPGDNERATMTQRPPACPFCPLTQDTDSMGPPHPLDGSAEKRRSQVPPVEKHPGRLGPGGRHDQPG